MPHYRANISNHITTANIRTQREASILEAISQRLSQTACQRDPSCFRRAWWAHRSHAPSSRRLSTLMFAGMSSHLHITTACFSTTIHKLPLRCTCNTIMPVCLSVCLWAGLLKQLWINSHRSLAKVMHGIRGNNELEFCTCHISHILKREWVVSE